MHVLFPNSFFFSQMLPLALRRHQVVNSGQRLPGCTAGGSYSPEQSREETFTTKYDRLLHFFSVIYWQLLSPHLFVLHFTSLSISLFFLPAAGCATAPCLTFWVVNSFANSRDSAANTSCMCRNLALRQLIGIQMQFGAPGPLMCVTCTAQICSETFRALSPSSFFIPYSSPAERCHTSALHS